MPHPGLVAAHILVICLGISLLAGFWTPVVGTLQAIVELCFFLSRGTEAGLHLMLFALGVGLAMVGPGAWSVDALLFGRKRIHIPAP